MSESEILQKLNGHEFLADFHLFLHPPGERGHNCSNILACKTPVYQSLCSAICPSAVKEAIDSAVERCRPALFHCPVGLIGFVLPLAEPFGQLVGSGVRGKSLNLYWIEAAAKAENINPFVLLEKLQEYPVSSDKEVAQVAERVKDLVRPLLDSDGEMKGDGIAEKLRMITSISSDIDRSPTATDTVALVSETIGILFDVPGIAVVTAERGNNYAYQVTWGFFTGNGQLKSETFRRFFSRGTEKVVLREEATREVFPDVGAQSALCIPLRAADTLHGFLVLFNTLLKPHDYLLAENLTARAALRMAKLQQEEEHVRKNALSARLVEMISTLALTDGSDLHRLILEMASELVSASCGSLMLLDENEHHLCIETAIGINPQLAKSMNVRIGTGIAGKVAASGHPLVVNDIEKDDRVGTPNRPRFKTKSFISMPLKFKGQVLGVLNLSDKKNNDIFTERDLEILNPFVIHVSSIIQRSSSQERVELLERLSITDPLTELYNRRFLEKRMEEEISRSTRNNLHLTVMLIDLDHFKTYNDICGHIAGDKALKNAATILKNSVREMDVVTRYGGEEFCILLPGTSKKESIFVAERIRRDIETELFHGEEHLPLGRLTTSIGISAFPEDGSTPNTLINRSDIALYRAKSEGRNRIVLYTSDMVDEKKLPSLPAQLSSKRLMNRAEKLPPVETETAENFAIESSR